MLASNSRDITKTKGFTGELVPGEEACKYSMAYET